MWFSVVMCPSSCSNDVSGVNPPLQSSPHLLPGKMHWKNKWKKSWIRKLSLLRVAPAPCCAIASSLCKWHLVSALGLSCEIKFSWDCGIYCFKLFAEWRGFRVKHLRNVWLFCNESGALISPWDPKTLSGVKQYLLFCLDLLSEMWHMTLTGQLKTKKEREEIGAIDRCLTLVLSPSYMAEMPPSPTHVGECSLQQLWSVSDESQSLW